MEDAAVERSLGEMGLVVSGKGVRPSAGGGRRRRESRAWRGGRMSNSCGGGSVEEVGVGVAVGMLWSVRVVVEVSSLFTLLCVWLLWT